MQDSEMELFFLSILLLVILSLSLSLKILFSKPQKINNGYSELPQGKTGWPVIGETLEFLSMSRKGTPEIFFQKRMNKFSPHIFKTSLLGEKTAVLCGPAGNKFLFSNENKLVASWWPRNVEKIFPTSLQTSTKEESIRMRKLLPGFLGADTLKKYVGIMDSIAREHLEKSWDLNKEITVLPLAKQYTFAVACRLFLSIVDPKQIAKFERPFHVLVAGILSIPVNLPGTPFNHSIKAANLIRKELLEIIRQRKFELMEKKSLFIQDILSHMLTTTDENGQFMTDLNIADKIIGLLIGGHDTASAAITCIVKYLAELPEIYDGVLKEQRGIANGKQPGELLSWDDMQKMKFSWNVASEVMRLAPPLQGNFREAITNFTYAGFSIPKGWKGLMATSVSYIYKMFRNSCLTSPNSLGDLYVIQYTYMQLYWTANSTHKNPEYFPEPEKFDPSRFEDSGLIPYTYVPFGGGPRMCPGKEYARLEILAFMYNLVRMFKWEKSIPDEKIYVDPMPMPAKGLPIRLYRH